MKFKTFATITTTMLGAALMGYGQNQDAYGQSQQGSTGAQNQSMSSQAGQENQAGQATQAGQENQAQRTGQAGGQSQSADLQLSEAERAQRAQAKREINWDGAQESQVPLSEIPQRARDTLNTVTAGAQLNEQVARLSKDGHEVYRATVNRNNEEDLHIFVQQDGTVVQTKQKVNFSDAPESVRSAIRQRLGGGNTEPQEFYRIIADEETSYVASAGGEGAQARLIRVNNTGNIIGHDAQGPQQAGAAQPESAPQDESRASRDAMGAGRQDPAGARGQADPADRDSQGTAGATGAGQQDATGQDATGATRPGQQDARGAGQQGVTGSARPGQQGAADDEDN